MRPEWAPLHFELEDTVCAILTLLNERTISIWDIFESDSLHCLYIVANVDFARKGLKHGYQGPMMQLPAGVLWLGNLALFLSVCTWTSKLPKIRNGVYLYFPGSCRVWAYVEDSTQLLMWNEEKTCPWLKSECSINLCRVQSLPFKLWLTT